MACGTVAREELRCSLVVCFVSGRVKGEEACDRPQREVSAASQTDQVDHQDRLCRSVTVAHLLCRVKSDMRW